MRELIKAWRDFESIFGEEYESMDFEYKWEAFIRWVDLNTKEQTELEGEAQIYEKWIGGNQATGRATTVKAIPLSALKHKKQELERGK